jgi:Cutinase
VTHRSIIQISQSVRNRIGAVVLFGDTQFKQLNGQVEGIDPSKVKIYCATGDEVCKGTLVITASHFSYAFTDASKAADWVVQTLNSGDDETGDAPAASDSDSGENSVDSSDDVTSDSEESSETASDSESSETSIDGSDDVTSDSEESSETASSGDDSDMSSMGGM